VPRTNHLQTEAESLVPSSIHLLDREAVSLVPPITLLEDSVAVS
jgi:hypothetical protein